MFNFRHMRVSLISIEEKQKEYILVRVVDSKGLYSP